MKKIALFSFGCQMNKLDTELVLGKFQEEGYERVDDPARADIVLFNTCSVRAHAEEKVYSRLGALKPLKRKKPSLLIAVMGCMAQKEGKRMLKRAPYVDLVCGTSDMFSLPTLVNEQIQSRKSMVLISGKGFDYPVRNLQVRPSRHFAYISIMRGCNNRCTYCVVPYVRGEEKSRAKGEIIEEVQRLVADGCREVTLLGQNIDSYGRSLGSPDLLADLLVEVNDVPGLCRIRFVTSHPRDLSSRLIQAVGELPKVCEYIHLPAQSGSDRVLQRMKRGYSSARYRELLGEMRETIPGVEIASDFIVGFPGEGEDDFLQTVALVEEAEFQNIYVFKYSPREGTPAAKMEDGTPLEEKKRRNQVLLALQQKIGLAAHEAMIGKTVEVLVEGLSKRDPSRSTGRTRGNRIVVFSHEGMEPGRLINVRIEEVTPLSLFGSVAEKGETVDER